MTRALQLLLTWEGQLIYGLTWVTILWYLYQYIHQSRWQPVVMFLLNDSHQILIFRWIKIISIAGVGAQSLPSKTSLLIHVQMIFVVLNLRSVCLISPSFEMAFYFQGEGRISLNRCCIFVIWQQIWLNWIKRVHQNRSIVQICATGTNCFRKSALIALFSSQTYRHIDKLTKK